LVEGTEDDAFRQMKDAVLRFLHHHGIDEQKYHETLTRAWILAVRHFMQSTSAVDSFDDFAARNPAMLEPQIMMTHYSHARLASGEARSNFSEPDLDPIPRYFDSSAEPNTR